MYREHVPLIAEAMRRDLKVFKRGLTFVILTIRQQITLIPDQLDAVSRGDYSPLFGFKLRAFDYIEEHGAELWQACKAARTARECIRPLLDVPGLGIVKAAFCAQLMGHNTACLDSRNVRREGRNPRAFRTDGKPYGPAIARKLTIYLRETRGKAARYWDTWCREVAEAYGLTPEEVSALHLAPLQFDLEETF